MKLNKIFILILILISPQLAQADSGEDAFLARIHDAKMLVKDLDLRSVEDISRELRTTSSPEGNLQIYEAIAATFRDLVVSGDVTDEAGKKNLYNQIRMNVAFIQFGGNLNDRSGKKIDRWIRQTLVKYLPKDLMKDEDIFYSGDEWR